MLVDLEPAMLALSQHLNPECVHLQGDMRSVRLGCQFDCVFLHDAVSYMASHADLASAVTTAFAHAAPGGVAMFQPVCYFGCRVSVRSSTPGTHFVPSGR